MNGIERIAAERKRQIEQEGWTPEHDAEHTNNELAWAAACYAAPAALRVDCVAVRGEGDDVWPWHYAWDKRRPSPTLAERIRELEKAGALVAAEIDRLLARAD